MWGREIRVPLNLRVGRLQEEASFQLHTRYAQQPTVYNFARTSSLNAGDQMKKRHDTKSTTASSFSCRELVWLCNPKWRKGGFHPCRAFSGVCSPVRKWFIATGCATIKGQDGADWFNAGEVTMESSSTLPCPGHQLHLQRVLNKKRRQQNQ